MAKTVRAVIRLLRLRDYNLPPLSRLWPPWRERSREQIFGSIKNERPQDDEQHEHNKTAGRGAGRAALCDQHFSRSQRDCAGRCAHDASAIFRLGSVRSVANARQGRRGDSAGPRGGDSGRVSPLLAAVTRRQAWANFSQRRQPLRSSVARVEPNRLRYATAGRTTMRAMNGAQSNAGAGRRDE